MALARTTIPTLRDAENWWRNGASRLKNLERYASGLIRGDGGSTTDSSDAQEAAEDYRQQADQLELCGTIGYYREWQALERN